MLLPPPAPPPQLTYLLGLQLVESYSIWLMVRGCPVIMLLLSQYSLLLSTSMAREEAMAGGAWHIPMSNPLRVCIRMLMRSVQNSTLHVQGKEVEKFTQSALIKGVP